MCSPKLCSMFRGARQASAPGRIRGRRCGAMEHEDARHRILAVVRYWNLFPAPDDEVDPRPPPQMTLSLLHLCLRHIEADGGGPSLLGEIQEAPRAAADV